MLGGQGGMGVAGRCSIPCKDAHDAPPIHSHHRVAGHQGALADGSDEPALCFGTTVQSDGAGCCGLVTRYWRRRTPLTLACLGCRVVVLR